MNKLHRVRHQFVDFVPLVLEEGVVYISIPYATGVHRCCCGCGQEVVTPLTPTDWALVFDGESVSLKPSIGNWGLLCRSHYWITRNRIRWAKPWTDKKITTEREADRRRKAAFFRGAGAESG